MVNEELAVQLAAVDNLIEVEVASWPWADVEPLGDLVRAQTRRLGKRLRPRLALALCQELGGDPAVLYPGLAGVELYHLAALVLDDIQDAATSRRGVPTVHTSTSVAIAINVAETIRSLAYHPIHRSGVLDDRHKAQFHRRLDVAATYMLLGQSMDVGWSAGWYPSHREFSYKHMAAWKTGALFDCAASMAAVACELPPNRVDVIAALGGRFGVLYQMVDDYLDLLGDAETLGHPALQDIEEGKFSYPVAVLLTTLETEGEGGLCTEVLTALRKPIRDETTKSWLFDLLRTHHVQRQVLAAIRRHAATFRRDSARLVGHDLGPVNGMLGSIMDLVGHAADANVLDKLDGMASA